MTCPVSPGSGMDTNTLGEIEVRSKLKFQEKAAHQAILQLVGLVVCLACKLEELRWTRPRPIRLIACDNMLRVLLQLSVGLIALAFVRGVLVENGAESVAAQLDASSQYFVPIPAVSKGFLYSTIPFADATCDGVLDFLTLFSPLNKTELDGSPADAGVRILKLSKGWSSQARLLSFTTMLWPSQHSATLVAPLVVAIDTIGE